MIVGYHAPHTSHATHGLAMLGPYLSIYLSSPHLDLLVLLALLVRKVLVVQPLAVPEAAAVAELVIRARAVEGVSVRGLDWHLVDLPLVLLVLRRVSPRVLDAGGRVRVRARVRVRVRVRIGLGLGLG